MLGLPSKPWKRIRLLDLEGSRYRVMVTSPLKLREEFKNIVEDDLKSCLGESDVIEKIFWEERSAILSIGDLKSFQRKLIFCNIVIEEEGN